MCVAKIGGRRGRKLGNRLRGGEKEKVGQQAAVHVMDYLLSKFVMLNADDKLH